MDPERARIQADLAGQLSGSIRCDDNFLQMYASDASIYEVKPTGVIFPANTEDVVACVQYAEENDLSIIPRGGGSNVVGGAVGAGLVLDFSYSMRRVKAVGKDSVTVEPGVVLGDLNRQLERHGRFFAPDPATRNVTTIGGTLAMNNSGSHWVVDGTPRDAVLDLQVVISGGEVAQFVSGQNIAANNEFPGLRSQLLASRVKSIVDRHDALVTQHRPTTKVNQSGYNVFDLQQGDQTDLTRLLVGSEGTLGVIAEATLATKPIPEHRGVALLFFEKMELAGRAAVEIGKMGVAACDLLDRRLLSLARETRPEFHRLIPAAAEAMLLVEFQGSDDRSVKDKLNHLSDRICRRKKWAFDVLSTTQVDQRNLFWRIVRRIVPSLYRLKGNRRALPFVEDLAIQPERLPEFLSNAYRIFQNNEVTASLFSHTPQGTIHIRPFVNLSNSEDVIRMQRLSDQLFDYVVSMNGTVSGSHGDGLSRTWYLKRQYGKLTHAFSEIKNAFDPKNVFNPGKVTGHPHSGLTDNIRHVAVDRKFLGKSTTESSELPDEEWVEELPKKWAMPVTDAAGANKIGSKGKPKSTKTTQVKTKPESGQKKTNGRSTSLPIFEPELQWQLPQIALAARNCNGCGRCRTNSPNERMCPIFRQFPREEASPRAKANLMRGIVTGELDVKEMATDEFKQIADLCVNCHQCRLECPASVDIPKLMIESKAQYFLKNGSSISDWMLTRLDWLYEIAGNVPNVTNRMLQSRMARWCLDKVLGIAQGRKLPLFSKTTFLRWAHRNRLGRPSKQQSHKVVFFVDAFVNWNDIELGKAFVSVLKHNGVDVVVPPSQNVSGMSLISDGAVARVKKLAEKNVEQLAEWVRQGFQIVTTEPSAALAIRHEYLNLLSDSDAELVAANTTDASSYLWNLHQRGDLELDFKPVNAAIGYHLPCHQRALGNEVPAMRLLRLVPGLQVDLLDKGCSGMAGTYGIKRKNYKRSLRMGFPLINAMRSTDIIAGTTECSTCKIQMEQGTTKPTVHPIKILAMAYGLMPELENIFSRRSGDLVIS
jgi:anaerobic glycerol-3-phosphate dehydrogenase C subunit